MSEPGIDAEPAPPVPQRSVGLLVAGAVLALAAASAILVVLAGSWGITEMYGSDGAPLVGALPWAALPAVLLTGSWAVTRVAVGRSARRWWVVLLASWAVLTLVVAVVVMAADRAHDDNAAARAEACSAADVALLTSVPGYSPDFGEPTGQNDGACSITIPVQGSTQAAVDSVVGDLEAKGWQRTLVTIDGLPQDADYALVTSGGESLLVEADATDDKGWTDVIVTVLADESTAGVSP